MTEISKGFTTGELIGIAMAKLSMLLVGIVPIIAFFASFNNLFDWGISDLFSDPILLLPSFILLFFYFGISNLIGSVYRLSGGIILMTCLNKAPDDKIKLLEEYKKSCDKWYYFNYNYSMTFIELGLLYKEVNMIDLSIKNLEVAALCSSRFRLINQRRAEFELAKIYEERNDLTEAKKWLNALKVGKFPSPENEDLTYIDIKEINNKIAKKEINEKHPLVDQNGDKFYYVGDYEKGVPHGRGVSKFSNKNEYIGDFKKGERDGEGEFIWANGDVYVGHFKNDQFDGYGKLIYKNGNTYSGQFKEGKKQGNGIFLTVDNTTFITNCPKAIKYEGEWVSNAKHGFGRCYDEYGKILYGGQFIRDYPVEIYPNRNEEKLTQSLTDDFLMERKERKALKERKAFFSYSKYDKAYLDEFKKHLQPLRRAKVLEFWDDSMILPGEEWNDSIKAALTQSDIIFLLLSADFLNTEYIWEKELSEAMHRFEKGLAIVIPIKIRACVWSNTPFANLQGLPRKNTIIGKDPKNDEVWQEIVMEVEDLLEKMTFD